jgi:replicative DNA helicase
MSMPIYVVDASTVDAAQILAISRAHVHQHGVRLVAVDFIQLVDVAEARDAKERVSKASGTVRRLAKMEHIPVIAVSQLRKPDAIGKVKHKTRPNMFLLKESGDVAQDAHAIIFTFREENDGGFTNNDELIIGKQREGVGRGSVKVTLRQKTMAFEPRAEDEEEAPAATSSKKGKGPVQDNKHRQLNDQQSDDF